MKKSTGATRKPAGKEFPWLLQAMHTKVRSQSLKQNCKPFLITIANCCSSTPTYKLHWPFNKTLLLTQKLGYETSWSPNNCNVMQFREISGNFSPAKKPIMYPTSSCACEIPCKQNLAWGISASKRLCRHLKLSDTGMLS